MSACETLIHLTPAMFTDKEKLLVEAPGSAGQTLDAYTFRFNSGVCGLRLVSNVG